MARTYVGGRAFQCKRCLVIDATHQSTLIWRLHWCNRCQTRTEHLQWIFVYEDVDAVDYKRRGCAAEGPVELGMPPGGRRFLLPMCALDEGHEGEHEDNITRDRWSDAAA